jgi:hypothetical protein
MAQAIEKASGSYFRRQVVFRIGEDDWPYLEAAAREHGGIQAGIIAALRAHAAQRLAARAEAALVADPLGAEDYPSPLVEQPHRPTAMRRRPELTRPDAEIETTTAGSAAHELVELNLVEAAPVLGVTPASLRAQIKRGTRPGRRSETGFYLAGLERDELRRANPTLTLRGAADVLRLKPATLRSRCLAGRYPNAHHDGDGWQIPARDLL